MSIGIGLGSFMSSFDHGYRLGRQMKSDRQTDRQRQEWDAVNRQGKEQFSQGVQSGQYKQDQFQHYWNETVVPQQIQHFMQNGDYGAAQGLQQYSDSEEARGDLQNFKKFAGYAVAGDHKGMADWIVSAGRKLGYRQGRTQLINDDKGNPVKYRFTFTGDDNTPLYQDVEIGNLAQFGAMYGNPVATWQLRQQQAAQQQERMEKRQDKIFDASLKGGGGISFDAAYKRMAETDPEFMSLPEEEKRKRTADYQTFANANENSGAVGLGGYSAMANSAQVAGTRMPGIGMGKQSDDGGSVIVKDGQLVAIDKRTDTEREAEKQHKEQIESMMAMPAPQDAKALQDTAARLENMGYSPRVKAYLYATYGGKDANQLTLPDNERDMSGLTAEEKSVVDAINASNASGQQAKKDRQAAIETRQLEAENNVIEQCKIARAYDMWKNHTATERQIAQLLKQEKIDISKLPEAMRERITEADTVNGRYFFKSDQEQAADRQEELNRKPNGQSQYQFSNSYLLSDPDEELAKRVLSRTPKTEAEKKMLENERLVIQLIRDRQMPSWAIQSAMRDLRKFDFYKASPELRIMLKRLSVDNSAPNWNAGNKHRNARDIIRETEQKLAKET